MHSILFKRAVAGFGVLLVSLTALPLVPSNAWWIRVWDFPRLQIAVLLAAVAVAVPALFGFKRPGAVALFAAPLLAFAVQGARMAPYTPLHAVQAERLAVSDCPRPSRVSLLTANVLMTNRRSGPLLDLIGRLDPDLVLLVETDAWWDEQLAPVKARYPHRVALPRGDTYGLHLFSRLPLVEPRVRFLIDDYVPSVRAGVRLPSGALIDFHGVHPKPPPLQDTARRDAELLITAREVRETTAAPSIVAGDLNDVAWSRTTRLFQEVGGLLDPRIGRGFYPTYNARWPLLRWPLDHVFFEAEFRLVHFSVEGPIGSDHFPVHVVLCHAPDRAASQARPDPEPADLDRAREAIREGRERAEGGR